MTELRTKTITHPMFGIVRDVIEAADFLPDTPGGWTKIDAVVDGGAYIHKQQNGQVLVVIISACIEEDGVPWAHLSVSKRSSAGRKYRLILPTWDDLKFAKASFAGPDLDCIQVLPRESEYVNLNEVLHLFWRLDGKRPCPDFTGGTKSI